MKKMLIQFLILVIAVLIQVGYLGNSPVPEIDLKKLNPSLQAVLVQSGAQIQKAPHSGIPQKIYRDENGLDRYGVIIKTTDATLLQNSGIHLNSVYGNYVTAKLIPEEIMFLASRSEVVYVDIPTISVNKMNNSLPELGAKMVHSGYFNNTPHRGAGAIVLIYDSGIDWRHPAFRDQNDTTKSRILSIWDQTLTPAGGESNPAGFNYGVEYTKAQIENELDGSPANFIRSTNADGHGSHVAGIAAGSGSKFSGVAPDADIIIVKGGDGSFAENDIIDGLNYAEAKSAAFGKPIVVNLSLGSHDGAHDGSRAYELVIDSFNSQPGQVAVVSAGNDGGELIHISGALQTGGSVSFQLNVPPGYIPNDGDKNDEFLFTLWYDENTTVSAKVTSPNGVTFTAANNQGGSPPNQDDGFIYLANVQVDESKQNISLYVGDQSASNPPAGGTWTLELSGASGNATYDGWLARRDVGNEQVALLNGNGQKTVSMPGTAKKAITVGAYVTKKNWPAIGDKQYGYVDDDTNGEIANFSSVGPTRDDRTKPDIAAPGKGIFSALSRNSNPQDAFIHPNGSYVLSQGTSFSAPHAAGAAAVMLGIDPSLTADQIKALFQDTAIEDAFTGSLPNATWGSGKLDMLGSINKLLNYSEKLSRNVLKYNNDNIGGPFVLESRYKLAVRFNAQESGKVTGLYLPLWFNYTPRVIYGNGNLNCAVFVDNNGKPSNVQLGSVREFPLADLDPGTNNYIDMNQSNININGGEYYHAMIWLSGETDSLKVIFDDGTTNQTDNPSLIYYNGNWYNFSSPNAFGTPYNLQFKTEITTPSGLNAISDEPYDLADAFHLFQNYPNPFNPSTNIRYILRHAGDVNLTIYDVLGRKVITLADGYQEGGTHKVTWNGTNDQGNRVPSGVYFYHLRSEEGIKTGKMMMLK